MKKRRLNYYLIMFLILTTLLNIAILNLKPTHIDQFLIVVNKTESKYESVYELKGLFKKYTLKTKNDYDLFEVFKVKGNINYHENTNALDKFDLKSYYLSQRNVGELKSVELEPVINLNLFQIKMRKTELFEIEDENNFTFLFDFNSFTILLLGILIKKIFYYFDVTDQKKSIFMILIYLTAQIFFKSFLLIYYTFKEIVGFIAYRFDFTSLEKTSLSFIILLLINPYYIHNISFQIIFSINFILLLSKSKNYILNEILVLLIMMPFNYQILGSVNLLILLFIPIIKKVLKVAFFPTVILYILFPLLKYINVVLNVLNILDIFLKGYAFSFDFFRFTGFSLLAYLVILLLVFSSKNKIIISIFLSLITISLLVINIDVNPKLVDEVAFIDVGQGDSAVIIKNGFVIVIDAFQYIDTYLGNKNIKKIDYLILTHNDLDHMKEAQTLIDNYEVKNLILSKYQSYGITHKNISYIGGEFLPSIEVIGLNFLAPLTDNRDENANSIVFDINVNNLKYLFTGDIDVNVEFELIKKYKHELKSDVLKVPHHGSLTSSSIEFLSYVKPSYAVVSVAKENRYNLPNQEVLDRYRTLGVYLHLTSDLGSIIFKDNQIEGFTS